MDNNCLIMIDMNICFIGHRKIWGGDVRDRLKRVVEDEIRGGGEFFTMGTHGDFDRMALGVCREMREKFKGIRIEVVLTSLKVLKKEIVFDDEYGTQFVVPYSDVETIMYDIEEEHFKRQIIVSNQKMIDRCDVLICFVDERKKRSGARLAFEYAKKKGLKIINLFKDI